MSEFQKLLLGSKKNVNDNPFNDEEEIIWLLDDATMQSVLGTGMVVGGGTTLSGWSFTLPQNDCTLIFGTTDVEWSELGSNGGTTTSAYGLLGLGATSYDADGNKQYTAVSEISTMVGVNGWTPTYNETYVKLHFLDSSDLTFYPAFQLNTWWLTAGGGVNGYMNGYIKLSNEIHHHEPDMELTILPSPKTVTFNTESGVVIVYDGNVVSGSTLMPALSTSEYTVYKHGYVPQVQSVFVGTSNMEVNVNTSTMTPAPYKITYNVDQSDAVITSVVDGIITVSGNTCYGYDNAVISYTIEKSGYSTIRGTHTVTGSETLSFTMTKPTNVAINLSYPFTDTYQQLTNLVDGTNFEIDASTSSIRSGSASYNVNSGLSYGYILIQTPSTQTTLNVNCYTSSESNWDFGGVYVGTKLYKPTYSQAKNKTTDGNGSYLVSTSGAGSATTYSMTLAADTIYIVTFFYSKDGSGNSNNDRFYIKSISYNTIV